MVEWKVGQKYRCGAGATVCTCIGFTTKNVPVVEYETIAGVSVVQAPSSKNWEEYKEPLKGEYWVNIYPNFAGILHLTREKANEHQKENSKRIACVRVPWTEGEGL